MMNKNYIALIGDLVGSKKSPNRDLLQENLQVVVSKINENYDDIIVSKLTITLGDEFQVLLTPHRRIFQLIDDIRRLVNYPIRFGIGYGAISTDIDPNISLGADGPAYWNARQAIENVENDDYRGVLKQTFIGLGQKDETIHTLLLLTDTIRSSWTKSQEQVFNGLLEENIYQSTFNQKALASKLDLSPSALSKRLQSGHIKIYLEGKETLGNLIMEVTAGDS